MHRIKLIIAAIVFTGNLVAQDFVGLDHRLQPSSKSQTPTYLLQYQARDDGNFNVKIFYSDEQILMEGGSIDSLGQHLDGISRWYYKNGNLQSEGEYNNGRKQGTWKRYTEDGSPKADRHYSEVNMNNIVFNSALVMPKPLGDIKSFENFVEDMVMQERYFDIVALSPIKIQFIITREGILSDMKIDDRLSYHEMQLLGLIIKLIPGWSPGSNGTQTINVRVNYSISFDQTQ